MICRLIICHNHTHATIQQFIHRLKIVLQLLFSSIQPRLPSPSPLPLALPPPPHCYTRDTESIQPAYGRSVSPLVEGVPLLLRGGSGGHGQGGRAGLSAADLRVCNHSEILNNRNDCRQRWIQKWSRSRILTQPWQPRYRSRSECRLVSARFKDKQRKVSQHKCLISSAVEALTLNVVNPSTRMSTVFKWPRTCSSNRQNQTDQSLRARETVRRQGNAPTWYVSGEVFPSTR